ncbi:MAG: MFS transporter, partial [Caulobacteraceae bacterium]
SLPALLVAAFAWGAASDAFVHGCGVALVDIAGDGLPRALARTNLWSAVGDLLGPLTVTICALAAFGWRAPFLGLGVSMLGYAAWLASQKLPPPPGRTREEAGPRRGPLADLRDVLADRRLIPLALALGLFGLLDEPLHAFVIAYLERAAREGPALAAAPVAAMLAGGMAGYAAYERLAGDGETGARRAALVAAAAMSLFLPAALFAPALALRLAAGFGFGIAGAVFHTALSAAVLRLRPGQAGAVSAAVSLIGMIDMGFPALAGWAADAAGLLAAIGLYLAVPPLVLALTALLRRAAQ